MSKRFHTSAPRKPFIKRTGRYWMAYYATSNRGGFRWGFDTWREAIEFVKQSYGPAVPVAVGCKFTSSWWYA